MRTLLSVQVTFSNGEKFEIPSNIIATDRAKDYASHFGKKGHEDYIKAYDTQLTQTMESGPALLMWVQTNMKWADVVHTAKKTPMQTHNVDFAKEFDNADFKVLEVKAP